MTVVITKQELIDAATDAQTFEDVINDPADRPNPGHPDGTVTSRLGETYPTLAKALADLTGSAGETIISGSSAESWTSTLYPNETIAVAVEDEDAELMSFWTTDGKLFAQAAEVVAELDGPIIRLAAEALARSTATLTRVMTDPIANMSEDFQALFGYGQSLMAGQVGQPGLRYGFDSNPDAHPFSVMLGASTRPQGPEEGAFWPIGVDRTAYASTMATYLAAITDDSVFTPLQGTTLDRATTRTAVLSEPAIEALVSGAGDSEGSDPVTAFTDPVSRRLGQRSPFQRRVVGINSSAGGRTLEQLQKLQTSYPRLTDGIAIVNAVAAAVGATSAAAGWSLIGGQFNYNQFDNDTAGDAYQLSTYPYADLVPTWAQDQAGVAALLQALGDDVQTDLRGPDQADPPGIFISQPSGRFTRDNAKLGVGMGHLQYVLDNRGSGVFGVDSDYPYPDWGGHMMSNGYRWRGVQIGKVMARVLVDRLDWDVFAPYSVQYIGNRVYVEYSPPVPPIRHTVYYGSDGETKDYDDWGLRLESDEGNGEFLGLDDFRVLDGCVLSFRASRAPTASARLWLGDYDDHKGGTNIADSDSTTLEQLYTMTGWMTLEDADDLAALVGARYPLQNFAWCGYHEMGWTR